MERTISPSANLSLLEILPLVCAVVILLAFVFLPWVNANDSGILNVNSNLTGYELMRQAPELKLRVPSLILLPICALAAGLLGLWGLLDKRSKGTAQLFILIAGIAGLVYYISLWNANRQTLFGALGMWGLGFWLVLAAALVLTAQIGLYLRANGVRDFASAIIQFAPLMFLIALILGFTIFRDRILDIDNIFNVIRQVSITGLIAIGMTFVILTGGIDLSVGFLLALAGMAAAVVAKGTNQNTLSLDTSQAVGYGVGAAALVAIIVGVMGGLLQGLTITRLGVPAFVVTLGGMTVFRGLTLILSNGGPISTFDESYRFWGQGKVSEVPVPVLIFAFFALLAHVILSYTRYGRHIYAVGGNQEAARLSGLNVRRLVLSVYIIVGFFCGLGGFVLSSRLNSSEAVAGIGYELTVIASVVIGGTSLFGGEGRVMGTVIGSLLIGVLINGLVLNNVSSYIQQIIIGVIIVLAVVFDRFVKSRRQV